MAQTTDSDIGSTADWVIDRILRGMIGGLMRLPYERRVALMGAATRKVIGPIAGYRKRAMENLSLIFPDMSEAEKSRIANGVLDNVGRTLIENYSWQEFGQRLARAEISGDGMTAVEEARANGRPILFITGHFGNHEAPRQVLTNKGYIIGGLYRPMKNAYFNDHYASTMTELSGPVFAQGRRGTAGFAKHLRGGGMGTLLFDVAVPDGVLLDFVGHPAMTATSAADIALRMDALLVPYFGIRQADGVSFDVAVETPIEHTTPEQMMAEATARLEARVRANPEQWFWVHNRWKPQRTRPADTINPGPGS